MKTKIWAHRGASRAAPENTMIAFEQAIKDGADGIELDVHFSADGHIVVTHDESCLRVTKKKGWVHQMTLEELRELDFGQVMPGFGFQPIPTLSDVFKLIGRTDLMINIELKNTMNLYPGLEAAVLDLAIDHGVENQICFSSFNHYSMIQATRLIRERGLPVICGLLYTCGLFEPWVYARRVGVTALHPHIGNLRIPQYVNQCHEAGIRVNTWTVDDPEQIRQAFALEVDAIITNVPDQAVSVCRSLSTGA